MKANKQTWKLKPFTAKESAPWKAAIDAARKTLKRKKRIHPALFLLGVVGKHMYDAVKDIYKKKGNKGWDLKEFTSKEKAPWTAAVASAQKQLKKKKRIHPALFMLSVVGEHLHTSSAALYTNAKKPMKAMKTKK